MLSVTRRLLFFSLPCKNIYHNKMHSWMKAKWKENAKPKNHLRRLTKEKWISLYINRFCCILLYDIAPDLFPTLRARPKYQLSSGSLALEDYMQQNLWDYTQQNSDWAALENPQIDTLDPYFEKTTMTTNKSNYISKLVRPRLTQKYIHVKPL